MKDISKIEYHILLVDDCPSNLAILVATLSEYRIHTATDGLQALFIANHEPLDLILLDIRMPGIDGYETCKRLKKQHNTKHIPVIFVTGLGEEEDETKGFALGAVDYITKPIRPKVLRVRVQAQLQQKIRREQLAMLADTDVLTGISNRRHFEVVVQKEWNRALRYHTPLCLVMMDVDYFKQYNDCYGHITGDECLKNIANCAEKSLRRAGDLAARWGGEEFVFLMSGMTAEQAIDLTTIIMQGIQGLQIPHLGSPIAAHVTVSFGLASLNFKQHSSWQNLLKNADEALYLAKSQGRNQLVVYKPRPA